MHYTISVESVNLQFNLCNIIVRCKYLLKSELGLVGSSLFSTIMVHSGFSSEK